MIAARPADINPPPRVIALPRFERLFRRAEGIDVDKSDLSRYSEFINRKLHDLLIVGEEAARLNGRKAIEPFHLPITQGLRKCIEEFRALDEEIELGPILDHLATRPPLDLSVWRGSGEAASLDRRRPECGASALLQNRRSDTEESADRTLAAVFSDIRCIAGAHGVSIRGVNRSARPEKMTSIYSHCNMISVLSFRAKLQKNSKIDVCHS
jgi:hypothetical protein